jgi:hypothetical protein
MGQLGFVWKGDTVAKRKRSNRKQQQERIFSVKGLGHATQVKNNADLFQVFFHSDPTGGKVKQIGTVNRATALEILKEIDATGDDYLNTDEPSLEELLTGHKDE